jgi:hypothetical protein
MAGRLFTPLDALADEAEKMMPDLCHGFQKGWSGMAKVAELMRITSYKPRETFFPEGRRPWRLGVDYPKTQRHYEQVIDNCSGEIVDDFRLYLYGRLWDTSVTAGKPELIGMTDENGNPVDGVVAVVAGNDEAKTSYREDPIVQQVAPPDFPAIPPLDENELEAAIAMAAELLNKDRPQTDGTGTW